VRIIAVANHKGGVGKTTTSVNLAAGLARAGFRTLLVDVDAQAHATFWWIDPGEVELDLQDVISRGAPVDKAIVQTRIDGLDLLPATLALAPLETELVAMTRREDRIARALSPIAGRYDVAVLDLAPSLSLVTLAALVAATDVLAPVSATQLAVGGLGAFLGWTDDFRAEGVITAPLLGVLVTMADTRTRVTREVLEALRSSQLPLFDTVIPRRIAAEDQVAERLVTGDPGAHPDLTDTYQRLTAEVITRAELRRG
jgi:chromosome partitioning protein